MMVFENVQIQLLDLPPLSVAFTESWIPQVIRNADRAVLVVDPNSPAVLDEMEFIMETLNRHRLAVPKLLVGTKVDSVAGPGISAQIKPRTNDLLAPTRSAFTSSGLVDPVLEHYAVGTVSH